jgi:hypothetical protein
VLAGSVIETPQKKSAAFKKRKFSRQATTRGASARAARERKGRRKRFLHKIMAEEENVQRRNIGLDLTAVISEQ